MFGRVGLSVEQADSQEHSRRAGPELVLSKYRISQGRELTGTLYANARNTLSDLLFLSPLSAELVASCIFCPGSVPKSSVALRIPQSFLLARSLNM